MRSIVAILGFSFSGLALAALPPITPGVPGKNRGDIIAPMLDEQIAAWCDFSKQIVVTHTNVLCAYKGDKLASPVARLKPKEQIFAKRIPKNLAPTLYEMSEYGEDKDTTQLVPDRG